MGLGSHNEAYGRSERLLGRETNCAHVARDKCEQSSSASKLYGHWSSVGISVQLAVGHEEMYSFTSA